MKFKTEQTNIQRSKSKGDCFWWLPEMEHDGIICGEGSVPDLHLGGGYRGASYVNIHWMVLLWFVHFATYDYVLAKEKKHGLKMKSKLPPTSSCCPLARTGQAAGRTVSSGGGGGGAQIAMTIFKGKKVNWSHDISGDFWFPWAKCPKWPWTPHKGRRLELRATPRPPLPP